VDLPESPRFSNFSRTTSTAKSLPRESTLMRLSPTVPLFRVVFSLVKREARVFYSLMSAP